jgi:hypothetical protein
LAVNTFLRTTASRPAVSSGVDAVAEATHARASCIGVFPNTGGVAGEAASAVAASADPKRPVANKGPAARPRMSARRLFWSIEFSLF